MVEQNDDNTIKWAAIPLTVHHLLKELPREELNDKIFNQSVFASIKYDGTNVGKD